MGIFPEFTEIINTYYKKSARQYQMYIYFKFKQIVSEIKFNLYMKYLYTAFLNRFICQMFMSCFQITKLDNG